MKVYILVVSLLLSASAFAGDRCVGDCVTGPYDKGAGHHGHPHEHDPVLVDHDHDPVLVTHEHEGPSGWEPTGWYTGFGFGLSDQDAINPEPLSKASALTDYERPPRKRPRGGGDDPDDDGDELAFRLFGGHDSIFTFMDNRLRFGAELGYANLGDLVNDTEVDAIDLTATVRFGLGQDWDLLGRLGGAYWDAEDDGTDVTGAIGVTKSFNDLRFRLEYQVYADVEGEDIDTIMLSAAHRF